MAQVAVERSRPTIITCDTISGAALEVGDLTAARAFYDAIFRDSGGAWDERPGALAYRCAEQRIEFVAASQPQTLPDSAQHQAYSVRRSRLEALVHELTSAGFAANWWHEDHPAEREAAAYFQDPSWNRVQLVAADSPGPLLQHFAFEVHDLEPVDVYYLAVLGGTIDYYHGRTMYDYEEAKAWGEGRDPQAAPWTRFFPGRSSIAEHMRQGEKNSHPAQQLFIRFGSTVLCLILGTVHRQEPPEEQVVGTPRLAFRTSASADEVVARLQRPTVSLEPEGRIRIRFERTGKTIYLRDPAGHFAQLDCGA